MRRSLLLLPVLSLLAACSGGDSLRLPDGAVVDVPAFETYTTDHNGYSRVRRDYATPADASVIAQFEDADPADPAGFRNLVALDEATYGGRMIVEVLAEVDEGTGTVQRLLRLTVDEEAFENVERNALVTASGQFYLRGANYAWVSIDGGEILSGYDARGLVDMVLDFDNETASLSLRTGVDAGSEVRTEIIASDLPFNVVTGAYGGDITVRVWDDANAAILSVDGALRGAVGGSPTYSGGHHDLSTAGLYTASGTDADTGTSVSVDGAFMGVDPNTLP